MAGQAGQVSSVPLSQMVIFAVCACASAALLVSRATTVQTWTVPNARATSLRSSSITRYSQLPSEMTSTQQAVVPTAPQSALTAGPGVTSQGASAFSLAALSFCGAFAAAWAFVRMSANPIAMASSSSESKDDSKEKMRKMVEKLDSSDMRLLARGGSMDEVVRSKGIDEVAAAIRADQMSRKDLTPKDVILELQRGNGRFWMGLSERPDMSAMERRALIMAQAPKVALLSCSDSRVPVEVIFDQGLGEVFVVRMAGNILNENAEGSLEFAVKYLGVKVVMVIGHEGCGAVKGAISMSTEDISKEPKDLQTVLNNIKSKLDVGELNTITDSRSRDREAIVLNTSNQVKLLQQNKLLAERVADGSLLVCGAFYEISSGIVDLFSLDKNGFVVDM